MGSRTEVAEGPGDISAAHRGAQLCGGHWLLIVRGYILCSFPRDSEWARIPLRVGGTTGACLFQGAGSGPRTELQGVRLPATSLAWLFN